MREQRQGLEWIMSCQKNMRLKWGCTKDLCCHIFLHFARNGELSESLHADDLVLMSETIEWIGSQNGRRLLRAKVLKLTLGKPS